MLYAIVKKPTDRTMEMEKNTIKGLPDVQV